MFPMHAGVVNDSLGRIRMDCRERVFLMADDAVRTPWKKYFS